jgi:hypothetical protein
MSDAAEDVTGCTILARGEEVGIVSNPTIESTVTRDGGWTVDELASEFTAEFGEEYDLTKTERTF